MSDERKKVVLKGQPQRGAARQATVSIRFEKLLVRAAADAAFRVALLADREAAVAAAGLELSPTERGMLRAMNDQRLAAMIDGIDLQRHTKRPFGRSVAAAVFAAAAASSAVATGCDTTEARPDGYFLTLGHDTTLVQDADAAEPGDTLTFEVYDPGPDEGVRPDIPDVSDAPDIYDGAARGALADVPEDDIP